MIPRDPARSTPASDAASRECWADVTEVFRRARDEMHMGEMIHLESFNLHAAMSAIELMDPKMDIGLGKVRDASEVVLPPALTDAQVLNVMDQLLVCELSWLDGHTLPQTVFSCVYSQRMYDIPRFELFSFLRVQIATMDSVLNLVLDEKVADDEDFIASTCGFNLRPLSSEVGGDEIVLQKILQKLQAATDCVTDDQEVSLQIALQLRLHLQIEFYRLVQCLSGTSVAYTLRDAASLLHRLETLTARWIDCPYRGIVDENVIANVFDASINRHLMTSSPPRTAPLFDFEAASSYMLRLLSELTGLIELEDVMLPLRHKKMTSSLSQRCSLQIAMHGAAFFGSSRNPTVLTRSLMSRIMIPEYATSLFTSEDADFGKLLATDMGCSDQMTATELMSLLSTAREGIYDTFKCLCRNRSRQRRQLLRLMRWWDHYGFSSLGGKDNKVSTCAEGELDLSGKETQAHVEQSYANQKENGNSRSSKVNNVEETGAINELFSGKTPIQLLSYEVSARLMIQHWLLGFECDLYQEYEYGAVFFYVGYVLTIMSNATTSLVSRNPEGASLHPLRYALHVMDEARLWMCRGMHSILEGLSRGSQWAFVSGRDHKSAALGIPMFGSEELWYEQRFGIVRGMVNGPEYADYAAFLSFKRYHEESLVGQQTGENIVYLLLKDANSSFLTARRALERAKKAAEVCSDNHISTEILQIARVAVANSLTISQLLKQLSASPSDDGRIDRIHDVNLRFERHRHFPVVEVKPA